jgi:hypothetical protein
MQCLPNKSARSQSTQKYNKIANSTSAAGQPSSRMNKLFKSTSSDRSTRSESSRTTAATEQDFRVRFSHKIQVVHKTLSRKDYTIDEIEACWYTAEDLQKIHKHCRKEIRKLNEGSKLKDMKYCSQGLEGHTTVGSAAKMRNRWLAVNAVLDEQMIQWEEGVFDEDAIAAIYCKSSSSCQLWANIVGRRDHRFTAESSGESCCSRRSTSRAAPQAA